MNTRELRAKRDAYVGTSKSILDRAENENRDLTESEKRDFDKLQEKLAGIKGTIDRAAQLSDLQADLERPVVSGIRLNAAQAPLMRSEEGAGGEEGRVRGHAR